MTTQTYNAIAFDHLVGLAGMSNEMIQNKKALANMTVATGENWIGNLSNKELKNMFGLG